MHNLLSRLRSCPSAAAVIRFDIELSCFSRRVCYPCLRLGIRNLQQMRGVSEGMGHWFMEWNWVRNGTKEYAPRSPHAENNPLMARLRIVQPRT